MANKIIDVIVETSAVALEEYVEIDGAVSLALITNDRRTFMDCAYKPGYPCKETCPLMIIESIGTDKDKVYILCGAAPIFYTLIKEPKEPSDG